MLCETAVLRGYLVLGFRYFGIEGIYQTEPSPKLQSTVVQPEVQGAHRGRYRIITDLLLVGED